MSTRCQVKVRQTGLTWEESVMLYHHSDGYPSYMLPKIAEAFKLGMQPPKFTKNMPVKDRQKYIEPWRLGRAGKAASFLCAADPGIFEPESGFDLHGDIEYFYRLTVENNSNGSMAENPVWMIEVFVPNGDPAWRDPSVLPTEANLRRIAGPLTIHRAARQAKSIECGEKLERCSHYAWYHNLLPKTSKLSTQTWLGNQPLEFHDAIGFLVGGKRYKATGSGGNSDYLRRAAGKNFPPNTWVSTVVAGNGKRLDIPTAKITPDGYEPYHGVTWAMPPTRKTRRETRVRSQS